MNQIQITSNLEQTRSNSLVNFLSIDRSFPTMSPATARKGRLNIVSNRLPMSIDGLNHDSFELKASSGGLFTGLRRLSNSGIDFLWSGWSGLGIAKKNASFSKTRLLEEHNAIPVMLDQQTSDLYYNGFSSRCPTRQFIQAHADHVRGLNNLATLTLPTRQGLLSTTTPCWHTAEQTRSW